MHPVSVVIVNFNGGPLLIECVRSVLASSVPVEIFVVDNASTDNSIYLLREHTASDARVEIIENASNLGFASANNIAIPRTRGDFLLFLNPDCVIQPDTIERMRAVMEAHPKAGMGGALILNADGTEQKGCRRRVPTPWRTFVRVMGLSKLLPDHPWFCDFDLSIEPLPSTPVKVDAISGSFMFTRRSAIDDVGEMDEGYFLHCEDLDWCMRFRQKGYDVLFVSELTVTHFKGVCGRRRPVRVLWHMHRGMVRFYRKFFQRQYSVVLMWTVFLAVWLRFVVMAAYVFLRKDVFDRAQEWIMSRVRPTAPKATPLVSHATFPPLTDGCRVMITGATSQVGHFLIPRLAERGCRLTLVSRRPARDENRPGVRWVQWDLSRDAVPPALEADVLVHLAPIWTVPGLIGPLAQAGIRRVIAFGSTSRFTKADSGSRRERELASRLAAAEDALARECEQRGVSWTVFRPTLIYGCGMDKNVTAIANFIRRFRFFPMAGAGHGKRQPVHADDLAAACVAALEEQATFGHGYNLSGGETLSYRTMVESIFHTLGRSPHIVEVPTGLLRFGLRVLRVLPPFAHVTPAMADRMDTDLCFAHDDAERDFGYRPRGFLGTGTWSPEPAAPAVVEPVRRPEPVLVTGANGFIGTALCNELVARGYRVTGLVRSSEHCTDLDSAVDIRAVGDIRSDTDWGAFLPGHRAVIHLVGYAHEMTSDSTDEEAEERYRRLNVTATTRVAEAAAAAGVGRFIYISSVKVHGEKASREHPLDETMEPVPIGPYARTKFEAEQVLRAIEERTGLAVTVVRPPLVYGPGVKANFLRLIRSIDRGMPLPLAAVQNSRSFVYVGNLVDMLIRCVDYPAARGETFLVSDGEDVSTPKLIRNIAYCLGREAHLVHVPQRLLQFTGGLGGAAAAINRLVDSLVIDDRHVRDALSWSPPYTMMRGLEETIEWYHQKVSALRTYGPAPTDLSYVHALAGRGAGA